MGVVIPFPGREKSLPLPLKISSCCQLGCQELPVLVLEYESETGEKIEKYFCTEHCPSFVS